jgi:SAM-dependent methyltransferase
MNTGKTKIVPTKRFSTRAQYYHKYRPGYPGEVIDLLKSECGLKPSSVIADVGSGTGILSELFLKNGNIVFGVEPNKEMREVAEKLLKEYSNFISIDGTAESTTLEDRSVDFVTVGHAFHWFDINRAKEEFIRILKPKGWVVLIWNGRRTDTTPFLRAYENLLLKFGTDYKKVNPANFDEKSLVPFFGRAGFRLKLFENFQVFGYEGLKGRLLSSSYVPMEGHPNFEAMMKELDRIFLAFQVDGKVMFEYDTKVYYGQIE